MQAVGEAPAKAETERAFSEVCRLVRPLVASGKIKRWGLRPLPQLQRADGSWAQVLTERAEEWQSRCASL